MTLDWSWGGDAPRNWTVVFRSPREHEQHEQALDCLRLGFIDMAPFLTHKLSLEDFHKAWAVLQTGDGVKVTIVVGS
jgi:threonine dehydrogenase-like Zn-dependent dehydrogenase